MLQRRLGVCRVEATRLRQRGHPATHRLWAAWAAGSLGPPGRGLEHRLGSGETRRKGGQESGEEPRVRLPASRPGEGLSEHAAVAPPFTEAEPRSRLFRNTWRPPARRGRPEKSPASAGVRLGPRPVRQHEGPAHSLGAVGPAPARRVLEAARGPPPGRARVRSRLGTGGGLGGGPRAPPNGAGRTAGRGGAGSAAGPAPSRRGAARGSAPQTSPTETAGVPPRLGPGRRPPARPAAAPRLTLYGGGGTNQRATSPFRFEAPDARLTPRAPRALIGCARRRSGREGGAAGGSGGGEVVARESPSPARAPALPGRSASLLPSSARPVFRARRALRSAGVPRALTGGRGRQSAGGRVPAPGLRRRIGGARGPGWEAGLPRGRGGGGAAPSQQPASAERAARSPSSHSEEEGTKGPGPPALTGRDPEPRCRLLLWCPFCDNSPF
ncbi:translation initiation factor IF-2-like [Vulpes lagopus]|uniref:translation initiation factor IF-2-like n=1 Tax=Vulpes lagopus TaxID=494514 RepID=UPI001BC8DA71|nr:translation initiation factor IF-2-like [Vulpes lagopus]